MLKFGAKLKKYALLTLFFICLYFSTATWADFPAENAQANRHNEKIKTVKSFIALSSTSSGAGSDKGAASPEAVFNNITQEQKAEYKKAAQKARRNLDVQTQLPSEMFIYDKKAKAPSAFWDLFGYAFNVVAKAILYFAIIVVVFILVKTLMESLKLPADENLSNLNHSGQDDLENDGAAAVARMDKAQLAADELARLGNFAEAIHVLLLQSLNELRRTLDLSIAVSLTSREILTKVNLSAEAKKMFASIVTYVELSYFGAREPSEQDYIFCRNNFDGLRRALKNEGFQLRGTQLKVLK